MTDGVTRLPLATKDGRANLIRAYKATGCCVCGKRYPELDWSDLHIDHIDPRDKPHSTAFHRTHKVSRRNGGASSVEVILAELLLCQVLCVKCHNEKHRNGAPVIEGQQVLFNGNGGWSYA